MKELKRTQAQYPFDNYWLYIILHKSENRYMANLIHKTDKIRTTLAYAKYLMCIHLKRILTKDEQVDHIDGNKRNDVVENFQILTLAENMRKMVIEQNRSAQIINIDCAYCNDIFQIDNRNYKYKTKNKIRMHCSRICAGKSGKKQVVPDADIS